MNRLKDSTSPYLLQHADNPVDWWPWCDQAFEEAARRDVPVLLSVGYAACHWCHVMAHESFEDPVTAALLNEHAVAIKVDREERPDVDSVYMTATQAMTGQGGWPMTVFMTPDKEPFFAGTYLPRDRFQQLILATGARDVALAFPGWDQPGVVGANGLDALTRRYDAFTGRRIAVLGGGDIGVGAALAAQARGLEVAAVIEVLDRAPASTDRLAAARIPLLTGHTPRRAVGGRDGVERLIVATSAGEEIAIDCDTICLAIGLAPAIELLNASGGRIVPDGRRGGPAPALDGWATSLPGVFAAGDCAGLAPSEADAAEQGRQAARQALSGVVEGSARPRADAWAYQTVWFDALTRDADPATIVCQCEAVTRGDLLEVRAPRYLGDPTKAASARDLGTLIADGPPNQDQVKRLTRAGMGPCQGRRCREQVALTLAQAAGVPVAQVPLALHRAPVRPLPLKVMADWRETAAMTEGWEIWFAIPGQWSAYDDIGTEREFVTPFGGEG